MLTPRTCSEDRWQGGKQHHREGAGGAPAMADRGRRPEAGVVGQRALDLCGHGHRLLDARRRGLLLLICVAMPTSPGSRGWTGPARRLLSGELEEGGDVGSAAWPARPWSGRRSGGAGGGQARSAVGLRWVGGEKERKERRERGCTWWPQRGKRGERESSEADGGPTCMQSPPRPNPACWGCAGCAGAI